MSRTISEVPIAPLVMELQGRLEQTLREELPAAGFADVRPTHCQVLRRIGPQGSRLTDLAAAVGVTKQSMVVAVDHLEAGGYVERVPDREDGRVKSIRLTVEGRRAARAIGVLSERLEREWAKKIGETRLEQLREALVRIVS